MPEPVTLVLIGVAAWSLLKGQATNGSGAPTTPAGAALAVQPAAATAGNQPISAEILGGAGPSSPLATPTSVANQATTPLAVGTQAIPIPDDLAAALDADTALQMRAYAALNPEDFQVFLTRYADRVVLRNDLFLERVTADPTAPPIEPTPQMIASMGMSAYRVAQALNGVAAGRSIDVFGVAASAAGQIPGVNEDLVSGLQAAALGYRAITSLSSVMTLAASNGVSVLNFSAMTAAGAYPGLAALPLAGVLMAVGLVVDIAFTIIGDKPDLQKAIDVALDVASLAVLFIPVIGIVIAIVIQLVKFIIDLFGEELFGGGMTHEQREVLETARYGENLNPMFPMLAEAYTPRELWRTIVQWGSGYCGGVHVVAMGVNLVLKAGDQLTVGGEVYTVPEDTLFGFGDNEQPGGCYWLQAPYHGGAFARITNDEQAVALGRFATRNGMFAMAQAGISDWRKEQFNDPTEKLIMARAAPMADFLDRYRFSLDQIDQVALEYRAQPHLNALAATFGYATWQDMLGDVVAAEWLAFTWSVAHGTLTDFARQYGYPSMYAFRAGAFASYEEAWTLVRYADQWATAQAAALQFSGEQAAAMQQQASMSTP